MANLLYYFPLDNLVNGDIVNNYKDSVKTSFENTSVEVDFDEYKGSFLNFLNTSKLELLFDKNITENGKTLINFFFNYNKVNNNGSIKILTIGNKPLTVSKIKSRNAISFDGQNKINDGVFNIRENKWFNASLYFNEDGNVDLYITDENFLFDKSAIISTNFLSNIENIVIGDNILDDKLKIADLSVFGGVEKDDVVNIINKTIGQHLTLLSKSTLLDSVTFNIKNRLEYNTLVVEEEQSPLFIEFMTEGMNIRDYNSCNAILKAKKGFFNTAVADSDDSQDTIIDISNSFKKGLQAAELNGGRFKEEIGDLSIINALEQERVLVQLIISHFTLANGHFSKTYTAKEPLILDKVFEVKDLRGKNECPFDVFIFGNDTLYNGQDEIGKQTVKLIINNISDKDLVFSDTSGFRVISNFSNIFQNDILQTINYELKDYSSQQTIPIQPKSDDSDFLQYQKEYSLSKGGSIVLEISGLKAKTPNAECPSGSYPFYLEYKNITGYKNGKVKFYIKTGKIFYSQKI